MHPYHQRRGSEKRLSAITAHLGDPAEQKILEVGALDGWFAQQLASFGARVTAADDHPALTTLPGVTVINERLTPAKIRKLGPFDAALCLSVLHHVRGWKPLLNALTKTTPLLFVETANPDEVLPKAAHHKDSARIAAAVESAGGVAIAATPGYDTRYLRTLYVIDQRGH